MDIIPAEDLKTGDGYIQRLNSGLLEIYEALNGVQNRTLELESDLVNWLNERGLEGKFSVRKIPGNIDGVVDVTRTAIDFADMFEEKMSEEIYRFYADNTQKRTEIERDFDKFNTLLLGYYNVGLNFTNTEYLEQNPFENGECFLFYQRNYLTVAYVSGFGAKSIRMEIKDGSIEIAKENILCQLDDPRPTVYFVTNPIEAISDIALMRYAVEMKLLDPSKYMDEMEIGAITPRRPMGGCPR